MAISSTTFHLVLSVDTQMLPRIVEEIERVKKEYPNIDVRTQQDGSIHIEIPKIPLPTGWSQKETSVLIILPVGYPNVPPNFCADPNLRLADGRTPGGSSQIQIENRVWLRFCWQPKSWSSSKELWNYIQFILERFGLTQ